MILRPLSYLLKHTAKVNKQYASETWWYLLNFESNQISSVSYIFIGHFAPIDAIFVPLLHWQDKMSIWKHIMRRLLQEIETFMSYI